MEFTPRTRYRSQPTAAARPPSPETHPNKRGRNPIKYLQQRWKAVIGVILVAAIVWLAYGYIHTKQQLNKLSNPSTAGQSQTQQLVSKVGNLVQLPGGETPTLATVNDASKLKNQQFFSSAQNGDKVLIYTKAGKAVLYRPSTNKVIAYAPINLNGR